MRIETSYSLEIENIFLFVWEGVPTVLSLKDEAEIFRIGLIIGYFTKKDVINWTDKVIETQENDEYEIIEASLLEHSSKADIASKLAEIKGVTNNKYNINVVLGVCSASYRSNKFTEDEIFTMLYKLISALNISIDSEIWQSIDRLSDGYYLATEGIYGFPEDIRKELTEFLDRFYPYAQEFVI